MFYVKFLHVGAKGRGIEAMLAKIYARGIIRGRGFGDGVSCVIIPHAMILQFAYLWIYMRKSRSPAFMFLIILFSAVIIQSCCPAKKSHSGKKTAGAENIIQEDSAIQTTPETSLPSDGSLSPGFFVCEAKILALDSLDMTVIIGTMLLQGGSLFYPVGTGDTLMLRLNPGDKSFIKGTMLKELVVEERLKLNSEKPEFIIRNIFSEKD
jgi:hypothetical protein